jgi:hypothetical protein
MSTSRIGQPVRFSGLVDDARPADTSACDAPLNSIAQLRSQGIAIAFARVRDEVRDRMRRGGLEAVIRSANFYEPVTDGVRAWQQQEAHHAARAGPLGR